MQWTMNRPDTVKHREGYTITLNAGSWLAPYDITLGFPRTLSALTQARLVREGLAFAEQWARKQRAGQTEAVT